MKKLLRFIPFTICRTSKLDKLEHIAEQAAACFDCCNVWGKRCMTEDMRKILCDYFDKEYDPAFAPEK